MAMNMSNVQTDAERGRSIIEKRAGAAQEGRAPEGHEGMEITPDPKVDDQTQRDIAQHGLDNATLGVAAPAIDPAVNKALVEGGLPSTEIPAPISPAAYLAAHPAFVEPALVFSNEQIAHAIEQSHTIATWLMDLDKVLINRITAKEDSAIESNSGTYYFFQRNAIGDALRELWIILQEMEAVLSSGNTLQFLPTALPKILFEINDDKADEKTPANIMALLHEIETVHDGNNALHGAIVASKSWYSRNESLASMIGVYKAFNGQLKICLPNLTDQNSATALFESSY